MCLWPEIAFKQKFLMTSNCRILQWALDFLLNNYLSHKKKYWMALLNPCMKLIFYGQKTSFEAYESVTKIQVERNDPIFLFDIHDFTLQWVTYFFLSSEYTYFNNLFLTSMLDTVQDFLNKLGMKPCIHIYRRFPHFVIFGTKEQSWNAGIMNSENCF